jgi:hypothetical protein
MFEHTLTTLLQIVIVIDLVGAAAYFVLAGLRRNRRRAGVTPTGLAGQAPAGGWASPWGAPPQPQPAVTADSEFGQLRRILDSYREGLG